MDKEYKNIIIGFSGYILSEECYEYNEDACYLANSKDVAQQFMLDCGYSQSTFLINEISINDLLNDYGCSSGEYAMEKLTFEKFKIIADENGIKYSDEEYYLDPTLIVVNIYIYNNEKEILDKSKLLFTAMNCFLVV
jgi:hypothetical protein